MNLLTLHNFIEMRKLFFFFLILNYSLLGQNTYKISGIVTNTNKEPLFGASVIIHEIPKIATTNKNGYFEIDSLKPGEYHIHICFLGYNCIHYNTIKIENSDVYIEFKMQPENIDIDEITIKGNKNKFIKQQKTTSTEIIDNEFVNKNLSINLIKSIENLPGISSIDIGQGFSKPVIRGLSFNRVAVSEMGIKQEGQQWGIDHGLEIDQFGVEKIEIIKGPASLTHGSDAIGGVINIFPVQPTQKNTIELNLQSVYKSVNDYFGGSTLIKYRKNNWHFYARYTYADFADYRVPADSFFYNRYRFKIENNTLKNTAGKEQNFNFTFGITKQNYKSSLSISNVNSKTGFFPGAHGIPSQEKLFDDGNNRNTDLPFQQVNHFKIISNSRYNLNNGNIEINLGYQKNFRQEWSLFHTHYQNQTPPQSNPNLELQFDLSTVSGDLKYKLFFKKNTLETGFSAQYQINEIAGYMFLLPNFHRTSIGSYIYNKFTPNSKITIDAGIRYDYGIMNIFEFFSIYTNRYKCTNLNTVFKDFTWALGVTYLFNKNLNFKSNIGKSFRMPNASELSSNGVHHGSFRYEVGDNNIKSEYSYQFDAGFYYNTETIDFEISFFYNYFPNFIFLIPTGSYLHPDGYEIIEADAGQVYQYTQSKAYRFGGEALFGYNINKNIRFSTSAEYVYATDGQYPIPFTPPLNIFSALTYSFLKQNKFFSNTVVEINSNFTATQNRVARNELRTNSYKIFNFYFSTQTKFLKTNIIFALQIQNILNTKYFNHLSFYRIIELPEAGRNFQISIKIPFKKEIVK